MNAVLSPESITSDLKAFLTDSFFHYHIRNDDGWQPAVASAHSSGVVVADTVFT